MIRVKCESFYSSRLRGRSGGLSEVTVSMSWEAIVGVGHANYPLLLQKPYCSQCLKTAGFACSVHYCRILAQTHISLVGVFWIYLLWFVQTAWEDFIHVSGSQVDFSNEHLVPPHTHLNFIENLPRFENVDCHFERESEWKWCVRQSCTTFSTLVRTINWTNPELIWEKWLSLPDGWC